MIMIDRFREWVDVVVFKVDETLCRTRPGELSIPREEGIVVSEIRPVFQTIIVEIITIDGIESASCIEERDL